MRKRLIILGKASKISEQKAKEKNFKASRLGSYLERLLMLIKYERSEWYVISQQ